MPALHERHISADARFWSRASTWRTRSRPAVAVAATEGQSHYLLSVMRRGPGDSVALFNGRDGEWNATIEVRTKRQITFVVAERLRSQDPEPDLWLMFAPLKAARLEMMVEKATELGVSVSSLPVMTRRTVVNRVNHRRLEAIAMEAAEQCERLTVPTIAAPASTRQRP